MQLLYFNFSSLSSSPGSTACSLGRYVSVCSLLRWVLLLFAVFARTYVYVHTCTHSNSSCKGTKKIPYMQIYMGNSFKNVDFVTKISNYSV